MKLSFPVTGFIGMMSVICISCTDVVSVNQNRSYPVPPILPIERWEELMAIWGLLCAIHYTVWFL